EKLTGTHIYSEISKKVYEHHKEETQQLRELDVQREGIATLSTEELTSLKEQKLQLATTITADEKQITALDKEVNWHEQWNKLQKGVKDAEELNETATNGKVEAKSREDQFQQITLVQSARPIFTELKSVQKQYTDKSKLVTELSIAKEYLTKQKKLADLTFEQAHKTFNAKVKEEEQAKPLLNQAKALDVQLSELAKHIRRASEDLEVVHKKEVSQTEQYTKAKAALASREDQILKLQKWKEEHESRKPIAEQEHLILSKLYDAKRILESLHEYNSRIKTAEEGILENTKEKQSLIEQEKAIQGQLKQSQVDCESLHTALSKVSILDVEKEKTSLDASIEEIVAASAHWNLLYATIIEKDRLQQELHKNREELKKNRLDLEEADKLLKTKTSERTTSLKMLEKAKLAAAESVDEPRKQLEPGEPCVVCGSTDHPYASH